MITEARKDYRKISLDYGKLCLKVGEMPIDLSATTHRKTGMPQDCRCKYQKEERWGYEVFRWFRKKWKPIGRSDSPVIAVSIGDNFKTILVVCRGCGAWIYNDPIPK